VDWLAWIPVALLYALLTGSTLIVLFMVWVVLRYGGAIIRIFEEKPFFLIKRPPSIEGHASQTVRFRTSDGLTLTGTYFPSPVPKRRGVVLFAPEYGASRLTCLVYAGALLKEGFDLFSFDFRNTGDSEHRRGYEPLQWVTNYEVRDVRAAIAYLKSRPDAPEDGIGFFGISRGAGAGILAAEHDPWVKCFVTDGMFGTVNTMILYMQKWISLFSSMIWLQPYLPLIFYRVLARTILCLVAIRRRCTFPSMKHALGRLSPRPLLMIHGANDSYIKIEIAEGLFRLARQPKELWVVEGAKHNQAVAIQPEQYSQRLADFFSRHLAMSTEVAPRIQLAWSSV
jgi:fermentation-respiration switch protein FrsA (DUF1100 family)